MDEEKELKFAKFFVDWVNKRYKCDYETFPNIDEGKIDTEIDVYVRSKMGLGPLNFQIVTSEGVLRQEGADLKKISKKTGQNCIMGDAMNLDSKNWIKQAINKKERMYSKAVKQSLILLVQNDIGLKFDEEYFKNIFSYFSNSEFKGIYLVLCPSFKESSSHPHDGQILAIKDFELCQL